MDRRIFRAVSGPALTAPAWGYVEHLGTRGGSFAALADERRTMTVTSAMVDAIAAPPPPGSAPSATPRAGTRMPCASSTT